MKHVYNANSNSNRTINGGKILQQRKSAFFEKWVLSFATFYVNVFLHFVKIFGAFFISTVFSYYLAKIILYLLYIEERLKIQNIIFWI